MKFLIYMISLPLESSQPFVHTSSMLLIIKLHPNIFSRAHISLLPQIKTELCFPGELNIVPGTLVCIQQVIVDLNYLEHLFLSCVF